MASHQAKVYLYVLRILKDKRKAAIIVILLLCLLACRRVKDKLVLHHRIGKTE